MTSYWFDLTGDERLGACATHDCGQQPIYRFEAHGEGTNYCSACREKIERLIAMSRRDNEILGDTDAAEARARGHNSTFYECPKCGEEANSAFSKCGCGLEPVSVCEADNEGGEKS